MAEQIRDGTGKGTLTKVSKDNRLLVESINELISSERSRSGKLWGIGTGSLSVTSSMSLGSVLWFKNDTQDEDWYVQKIIFGWNGGNTNKNRTIFSLIHYNTPEPSANNTSINAQNENISLTTSSALTKSNLTGYKWDEVGTGMTVAAGGFAQIPNRISVGNNSIPIDGEIILGPGNSMEFRVTPEEDGEFNVAVVFYTVPTGRTRSDDNGI